MRLGFQSRKGVVPCRGSPCYAPFTDMMVLLLQNTISKGGNFVSGKCQCQQYTWSFDKNLLEDNVPSNGVEGATKLQLQ